MDSRLEQKVDKILEDVTEIKTHLAVYNAQLEIHIKRSDLLEQKLEPVERHVSMVNGALKFIGVLAALAAVVEAIAGLVR